ncbi:hypothetical protein, conserved [Babesia ovata]|uniref:Uncharacterized protein n=1 Tax=Babesia ovata TaxID=189622 RepID=A0A2H6KCA1_9APIC|nr:uncharacterized protein BOVATA_021230 [Babesia ovata]GBE60630.1 hypothetical protein, conserved [Babesia ovata]
MSPKVMVPEYNFPIDYFKPTATAEQLDNLYFRERDAPKQGQPELGENIVYELCQLDASLEELFREGNVDFTTHQQIHKFRLRVSRRISAFGGILRKLLLHSEESASANSLKFQSLHRFYVGRLMRLVRQPNCNRARVLEMIMSRTMEQDDAGDMSLCSAIVEDESEVVLQLKATRNMMLNQISQMSATESSMLKSSNYILRQEKILSALKQRFGSATRLLGSLRRKTLNRYGTVRLCYFTFLGMCLFIILRRFRVFKLVYNGGGSILARLHDSPLQIHSDIVGYYPYDEVNLVKAFFYLFKVSAVSVVEQVENPSCIYHNVFSCVIIIIIIIVIRYGCRPNFFKTIFVSICVHKLITRIVHISFGWCRIGKFIAIWVYIFATVNIHEFFLYADRIRTCFVVNATFFSYELTQRSYVALYPLFQRCCYARSYLLKFFLQFMTL